jgi:hypothetical protein
VESLDASQRANATNVLEVLQNRVLIIIRCKPVRFPTISLYDLGVIPLKVINQYELLLWLYKIVKNKVCHHFQLVRVAETHRYPTRTSNHFVISSFIINWGRNCILVDDWLSLMIFLIPWDIWSRFHASRLNSGGTFFRNILMGPCEAVSSSFNNLIFTYGHRAYFCL